MQYTYVVWRAAATEWRAFCPAWPAILATGETRAECLATLNEKLGEQCEELFCRGLPYPPDVAVAVSVCDVLSSEFMPWA